MTSKHQKSAFGRFLSATAALMAASISSGAQTAPATNSPPAKPEATVALEAFEVTMTQDKGYFVGNAGNGMKTNEPIMKIPQSISVITRDMIDDIASSNLSDLLNYMGLANTAVGESAWIRGGVVPIVTDGAVDASSDPASLDSISILRGPAAVLYGIQGFQGFVLKTTKIPTAQRGGSVVTRIDQWGGYRADLDYNSGRYNVGETQFSYRFSGANQGGKVYQSGLKDNRDVAYLIGEVRRPGLIFRLSGNYQNYLKDPHKNNFLTPDGRAFVGAGMKESYQRKDAMERQISKIFRMQYQQLLGTNWSLNARGAYSDFRRGPDEVLLVTGVNYQTGTVTFFTRRNDGANRVMTGSFDIQGKNTFWNRELKTVFGSTFTSSDNPHNFFFGDAYFGERNGGPVGSTVVRPMNNPQVGTLDILPGNQYVLPFATSFTNGETPITNLPNQGKTTNASLGGRLNRYTFNIYLQENIEVIPDRLNVVLSGAYFFYDDHNQAFTSQPVAPIIRSTINRYSGPLHRVGLTFNLTRDIVLYALSTETSDLQTSRLIDGSIAPPVDGTGEEVGIKTALLDGRINATVSFYDQRRSGQAVSAGPGVVSPITGQPYAILAGTRQSKGVDYTLALKPLPNWDVMINGLETVYRDLYPVINNNFGNTYKRSFAVFSKYQFTSDALKRFTIGGGAHRLGGRLASGVATNAFVAPDGRSLGLGATPIVVPPQIFTTGFVQYTPNRRWSFKLNVNNITDILYVAGYQHPLAVDIAPPRTFSLIATYRF